MMPGGLFTRDGTPMSSRAHHKRVFRASGLFVLLMLVGLAVLNKWRNMQSDAASVWFGEAHSTHGLRVKYQAVPLVPRIQILKDVLSRRAISVLVFDEADVEALLSMPDCPVKLFVQTDQDVPATVVERLMERFGAENVGPW
jgi:hypothetical protein